MKKLVSLVLMLGIMLIGVTAFADYPTYLGGNRNYIMFDGHQGVGRYIDRKSLNVEIYNPPTYVIAIDWVAVPNADRGSTSIEGRYHERFRYDWNNKKIYRMSENGEWRYIDPQGSRASGSSYAQAAEIAFGLAYKMRFLGIYPEYFYDFMN